MIKVLNLYAGIGGNRKLWKDVEVTAIEIDPNIASIYKKFFPEDRVLITDAHQYLLEHFEEFDFIWSSISCTTHSRARHAALCTKKYPPVYPDMNLYQEIIFLEHHAICPWVVENVLSYYKPLIGCKLIGRHLFWSNFEISNVIEITNCKEKMSVSYFDLSGQAITNKRQLIENCVNPDVGLHIFNCAFKLKQQTFS